MAYAQPEIDAVPEHNRAAPARRRRKVIIGVSCLLGIVVVGAASIITMLIGSKCGTPASDRR